MKSRSLVLLSGEGTTVPLAEAKALFRAYDPDSSFENPEPRVLIAESKADPFLVGSRVAFSRRVGHLVEDASKGMDIILGGRFRLRGFDLVGDRPMPEPGNYLRGLNGRIDLRNPEFELTLVRGRKDYLAVTAPLSMAQGWSLRRPRGRAFFHPSAIFPKLSRALVNLSRCRKGDVFLDPFAGTGSLPIEASIVGARVVAFDQADKMTRGALANMRKLGQAWLGVLRVDSISPPIRTVDAIATDIPYGRASSTRGRGPGDILDLALSSFGTILGTGSRMVLMHPQQIQVRATSVLQVEEEHHLHVHKHLTRTITVLRKK